MASSPVQTTGGIPLAWFVFSIVLTLKLAGVVAWSWWWVFAPLWLPVLLFLVGTGILAVVAFWPKDEK
ncbi:hypothetical protein [Nocardia vulneris]|uniref:hypothetical protein n=1 Tax=Nocardia vulneris TaxID=1141657 RepID=UPI0005BC2AC2|nr:hypothetical protein [Nocardia vulneris]